MDLPDRTQAKSWEGRDVADSGGQRLGRCVGVFADTATGVPEWLDVDVEGHGRRFIPAIEATDTGTVVRVRFSVDQVAGAPRLGDEDQLSKAEEVELYRHYGVPVESSDSGSVLPTETGGTTESVERPHTGEGAPVAALGAAGGVAATSAEVGSSDDTRTGADTGSPGTSATGTSAGSGLGTRPDADSADVGRDDTGPAGLVETGQDLPVLDPAAASVPVPEGEVGYVDQPESFATDEPAAPPPDTAPAAEPSPALPPPTLRRVSQSATPPAASPSPSGGTGPDLAAAAPLGALAAAVAAIALVLRAREARQRRRNAPAARADRLRKTLQAGSAAALAQAGSALSSVPDAAAQTRRSAAEATAKAGRSAARRKARASRSAARRSRRQKRQAAAAVAAASSAASKSARDASSALSGASRSSASRTRRTARTVAATPTRVAKRGRKARRSVARTLWDLVLMSAAGGGYVLGAKAGRERYDELAQVASAVAASPQVQAATASVRDPQRRADLVVDLQQQAASLVGRRGEHRG